MRQFKLHRYSCINSGLKWLEMREIVDGQIETIEREWSDVCELARLSEVDRRRLWRHAVLNPYATEGYPRLG